MRPPVSTDAREIARQLDGLFGRDACLAARLNDAQRRLTAASQQLWDGLHPDGLAALGYDQAEILKHIAGRSAALAAENPLAEVQRARWQIHRAFGDYRSICEERRQLAAEVGELTRALIEALRPLGRTEGAVRAANIQMLANPKDPG
jgi:hypothetical protein